MRLPSVDDDPLSDAESALQLPDVTWEGVALGIAVLVVGVLVGRVLKAAVGRVLLWRGRSPSASALFASLTGWAVGVLSFAAAVTIVFPSVRPVNALGGLGVLSIAAGIAFQTVLGNMFAGIVILARDKFRVGDQIAVQEVAGTVTHIALTATRIRSFDGRLLLIPNSVLHSEIVTVQTGYDHVRSTVSLDIDDGADLDLAVAVAERSMAALPDVMADPPPQALLREVGSATVKLDLRFWSGARQMDTRVAQHRVIRAVLRDLADAEVRTGSDVLVLDAAPGLRAAIRDDGAGTRS
ncbi:mechanosensitive ion channel family protein [Nocardioides sp. SYSU DS0663]|uniref:mechanosensitive ion channel family protein n=1 Tax=Nocardioides sp. SYSU DS0663 TaxID=3416445 RepID=UPI003F4B0F99